MSTDERHPWVRALISVVLLGVVLIPIAWCTGLWGAGEITTELVEEQTEP